MPFRYSFGPAAHCGSNDLPDCKGSGSFFLSVKTAKSQKAGGNASRCNGTRGSGAVGVRFPFKAEIVVHRSVLANAEHAPAVTLLKPFRAFDFHPQQTFHR